MVDNKHIATKTQFLIAIIIVLAISITGTTYAYFAIGASDNETITGDAATVDLTLNVSKVYPTTDGMLVPQLSTSNSATSPLANALKRGCIDDNTNVVCHVYRITIQNIAGSATQVVDGSISFFGNPSLTTDIGTVMPNLKWRLVNSVNEGNANNSVLGANVDHIATSSEEKFVSDLTMEINSSYTYYIIVWLNETNTNQEIDEGNSFYGVINFDASNGSGVTSVFGNTNTAIDNQRNNDASTVLTTLKNKASSASDGVYYFDSTGNLDYGNGTKVNLSLSSEIPKGVVSYSNHTLIYACMNYGNNNYEYDIKTNVLNSKSTKCLINRYQNLVTNGDLSFGNNTNLTGFGDYNSEGYISKTASNSSTILSDEFIPIDTTKKYVVSVDMKASNTAAKYYVGIAEYDVSKNSISAGHVMYINNTQTTLSQDLKKNDTVVHFTSLANWNINTSTRTYQRGFLFWNYKDATNYTYPQLTYSRNLFSNYYTSDSDVNKTNNTISLTNPWQGNTIPAGTKVSQSNSGSGYNYSVLSNGTITTNWKNYSSPTITTINNTGSIVVNKFRAGTKFIKFMVLNNNNSTANTTTYFKNISIREEN